MHESTSLRSDLFEALSLLRRRRSGTPFRLSELRWVRPYASGHVWRIGLAVASMVVVAGVGATVPALTMVVIDSILPAKNVQAFTLVVLAILTLQILRPVTSFIASYHLTVLGQSVQASVREDLFRRLVRLPMAFLEKRQTGYLVARLGEVAAISTVFSKAMLLPVMGVLESVLSLAVMLYINWQLTIVTVLVLPFFFLAARVQSRGMRAATESMMEQGAVVSQHIQESLQGVQTVKTCGAEDREAKRMAVRLRGLMRTGIVQSIVHTLANESVTTTMPVAGVLVLWISGRSIMAGTFTIGGYVAFTAYLVKFIAPIQMLTTLGIVLQQAGVALHRVIELIQETTEDEAPSRVEVLGPGRGHLVFEDVHFRYPEAEEDVLRGVTLEIQPGECVAIVGPSGSGKSTLIKLMLGLYPVTSGVIRLDGHDIQHVTLASLRDRIAVVSQDVFLFNDTLRRNILYSQPDASEAAMIAAARAADAHAFISELPQGYDTVVGEGGASLSGGQRQRISIARALLRKADVVLLDEATSQLDGGSERRVWRETERCLQAKTRIVVSHRTSSVLRADRVVMLQQGRVAASGRHPELLRIVPHYEGLLASVHEAG